MLFTNPIWLIAIAAISIPVIIHLWNIKSGKTLKVGSIALFTASSSASSRSFKLLDILLLLLRCSLLILLALLLAAPLLQRYIKSTAVKGWVLVPPASFKETYQHFQPKIDSLVNNGYEVRFLETGFEKQDLSELKAKTNSTEQKDTLNYWTLVKQLAGNVAPSTPVEIFTPNTIIHFSGEKPETPFKLNWHTYTPTDSIAAWPAHAWLMANGNTRVLQGRSTQTGTEYQYRDIINGQNDTYKIVVNNGSPYISFENATIPVDTSILRIAIYSDNIIHDVNYLTAALLAVSQLTGRNTIIKLYNNAATIPADQTWIYWLSEKAPDATTCSKTKSLFIYQAGKPAGISSWISNTEAQTLTQGQPKIQLHRYIISKKTLGDDLWVDGFGNAILSAEQTDKLTTYHFYSRFNPAWNDLVWSDDFPKWLLELTQPINDSTIKNERRALPGTQVQPVFTTGKTDQLPITHTDISFYLWLLMLITFAAERWLATKNKLVNG
jgi:hypothetical protein